MIQEELGATGAMISAIGQGCMGIGGELASDTSHDDQQVRALQLGIDLGMTFIDTAEAYGAGHSEEIVARATEGRRADVFIATKFSPEHNSYADVLRAAENSLRRLRSDYIDLYQVHWPNPAIPIEETMRALEQLVRDGKVRYCGVSNFSVPDMVRAAAASPAVTIASNQVEYNLFDRFVERRILPYCVRERITLIAYSPLDKRRASAGDSVLGRIAARHEKTPAQVVLNWLVRHAGVVVIPKASNPDHIRENAASADFLLEPGEYAEIDRAFPSEASVVPVDKIRVSVNGEGARKVYQTVEEARANALGFSPSPEELAEEIVKGEPIKPVRLVPTAVGPEEYELVEGRIRYWAWTIAHGAGAPIPALIRTPDMNRN